MRSIPYLRAFGRSGSKQKEARLKKVVGDPEPTTRTKGQGTIELKSGYRSRPPNVLLLRALWSPLDGVLIWGVLESSWGVLGSMVLNRVARWTLKNEVTPHRLGLAGDFYVVPFWRIYSNPNQQENRSRYSLGRRLRGTNEKNSGLFWMSTSHEVVPTPHQA